MSPRARSRPLEEDEPGEEVAPRRSLVRRLLARDAAPGEHFATLLRERRAELEGHVARIEDSALDLERREELLRDSRASLERLLRMGTSDLDARESELAQLIRELDAREARIRAEEAELARRRGELGAVELRRASVELRERALDDRESEFAEREARLAGARDVAPAGAPLLAFVPGTAYGLVEIGDATAAPGEPLVLDGEEYVVARVGPSPLPGDRRRCAYLVRGARGGPDGSS